MFKLVLLYFELVAIFSTGTRCPWTRRETITLITTNQRQQTIITVATCLAANCWRVTEASSCPYLAFPSETETGHVNAKKRACRRFQNYQAGNMRCLCGRRRNLWLILPHTPQLPFVQVCLFSSLGYIMWRHWHKFIAGLSTIIYKLEDNCWYLKVLVYWTLAYRERSQ